MVVRIDPISSLSNFWRPIEASADYENTELVEMGSERSLPSPSWVGGRNCEYFHPTGG